MASRKYSEYLQVDPNFIPVFSRDSDKIYPDKWQSFYPHESFKTILRHMVETLEKSTDAKDRSIWMSGAYGTGKTYASFVIKHILEDSLESVTPYFTQNGMDSLLARVKGVRARGRVLVAQRSSSAGINTQDKLFYAIVDSVRKAVKDAGLSYTGAKSLSDKVLETLRHPETSAFNFPGVFQKYRGKFTEYSGVESIIRDLEELDSDETLDLLDTIVEVAALEGFNWSMSSEDIVDWLEDVRKGNDLYAIVFIWDEFTEYFHQNQNNITGLQEIAQASSRINCYLFLITHSSAGQLIQDQASRKIIEARFKLDTIELGESTAFTLLGAALRRNPDLETEWAHIREQLWEDVRRAAAFIQDKDISVRDGDFVNLLPMHPYAAYLLKFIAKDISSNQRTIFKFLSGGYSDEEDQKNFRWFIEHFSYDYGSWNYLTVDFLWDYFFRETNVDLDAAFTQVISHYHNFAPLCDDPENERLGERRRRALKVTLLLAALQMKNGAEAKTGAASLMRPTLANIKACFAGTPQESCVEQDLNYLVSKGMMGKIEVAREVLFVMTSAAVDTERMERILDETRRAIPFEKLVADPGCAVADKFMPDGFLARRMRVFEVSAASAKAVAERVEPSENHIPVFFLFAKNEGEQAKVKETVRTIFDKAGERCVVVDFSSLPFTDAQFDKFIKARAEEKYFSTLSNQKPRQELAKKAAQEILNEWIRKLITTSLYVYTAPDKAVQKNGGANLRKEFREINASFYGCGLEEISQNDKLFAESGFKESVALMAMGKIDVPANYSYVRNISRKLQADGIWDDPKYRESHPAHPVSKMKAAVSEVVSRGFETKMMVSVTDIWAALRRPPFGLLPNTGTVFLLGFLMKEYASGSYYKRDVNSNTVALDEEGLSELLFGVVKDLPKARGQFIVMQTPQQKMFCAITGGIFRISGANSVDDIAKSVNIFLTNTRYPMWTMRCYIEKELRGHEYFEDLIALTDLFCEFIKPQSRIGRERAQVVEDICGIYKRRGAIGEVYRDILTAEHMRQGMNAHIASYQPKIVQLADSLGITAKEYLDMLGAKLSGDSSYLWETDDTNRQIDSLCTDLEFLYELNRVLTDRQKTYDEARTALTRKLNVVRIPYALLRELKPNLLPILDLFREIAQNARIDKAVALPVLSGLADDFCAFFNSQSEVFRPAADRVLNGPLSEDEYEYLFERVPSGVFFDTTDAFAAAMQRELNQYRKSKKSRKLRQIWKELTNSASPAEWSLRNGIPVLCLFTDDILRAQRVFDALNGTSVLPSENDMDDAIAFLQSGKLRVLNDRGACRQKFREFFAGEYAYLLPSDDELRDRLREAAGGNVYDWYAKAPLCRDSVKRYAAQRYQSEYRLLAKEKIRQITASQARQYLEELIDSDPLLGIHILRDSSGGQP